MRKENGRQNRIKKKLAEIWRSLLGMTIHKREEISPLFLKGKKDETISFVRPSYRKSHKWL